MAHAQQVREKAMVFNLEVRRKSWQAGRQAGCSAGLLQSSKGKRSRCGGSCGLRRQPACHAPASLPFLTPAAAAAAMPLQLSEHADRFKWVGYISSTSGRHHCAGNWNALGAMREPQWMCAPPKLYGANQVPAISLHCRPSDLLSHVCLCSFFPPQSMATGRASGWTRAASCGRRAAGAGHESWRSTRCGAGWEAGQ